VRRNIDERLVLSRAPEGPLAGYIGSFARSLRDQGYALQSIRHHVLLAADFSRWLKRRSIALGSITSDQQARYYRHRVQRRRLNRNDRGAINSLFRFLNHDGIISTEKIAVRPSTSLERCAMAYERYLVEVRGLSKATIIIYIPFVRSFLRDRFGARRIILSRLCARDVVTFVRRQARQLHVKRAKMLTSALRSFLRYVRYCGKAKLDLAAAVPTIANRSMSTIPRAISTDQIHQLLASIDRRTPSGRRDCAILLLLARLGLRASAVAFLELHDIDWEAGTLNVRGKSGRNSKLPLPHDVGKAIVAYLRHGRPKSDSRRLFLRAIAPMHGFEGATAIAGIVRRCLKCANIVAPTNGAHQFRHGLATEMLRKGASLDEIGELLGHCSPETTKIYINLDLDELRTLSLPWPGGTR
jgi:integrase/recombinase XerD